MKGNQWTISVFHAFRRDFIAADEDAIRSDVLMWEIFSLHELKRTHQRLQYVPELSFLEVLILQYFLINDLSEILLKYLKEHAVFLPGCQVGLICRHVIPYLRKKSTVGRHKPTIFII